MTKDFDILGPGKRVHSLLFCLCLKLGQNIVFERVCLKNSSVGGGEDGGREGGIRELNSNGKKYNKNMN